jgi:hypothetical protein
MFDKADIALGKRLVANISKNQWQLGELADGIEKKYGDSTLEDFAEAIGIHPSTLNNCRHVWRRWKNSTVRPQNYAVAKALASYKDKDWYIENWPHATEREAREDVRRWKREDKKKKELEMLNVPKKGTRLGNWTRAAEKLIKEISEKSTSWERRLELLSQRAKGVNLGTVADLIITLRMSSNMLLKYEELLKDAFNISEEEPTEEPIEEPAEEPTKEPTEKGQEDMGTSIIPFRMGESDD